MATSGSIDSGGYQGRVLRFSWDTASTSGNTRTISYSITAVGGSSSNYYHHNNTVSINGTNVYTGGQSDYVKTGTVLKSGTFSINQDNTTTLTVEMHGGVYSYSDNINTSYSWTLDTLIVAPTIKSFTLSEKTINTISCDFTCTKADTWYYKLSTQSGWTQGGSSPVSAGTFMFSSLTPNTTYTVSLIVRNWVNESQGTYRDTFRQMDVTTYKIATLTSVPNVTIGNSQTITWDNPSGATTSLVLYKTNGATPAIHNFGTVTGTSNTYTADASTIYALTPNSTTYRARYTLTTTQNGLSYTNSADFNFLVNETVNKPTFSNFDYEDINTSASTGTTRLTNDNSVLIKNYSRVKATVSTQDKATPKNSATMTLYKFELGNQNPITANYSASANVELSYLMATNNVLSVYAVDSRGLSTKITKTLTSGTKFIEYEDLKITNVTATRDSGGAGQGVTLTFNGTFWNNTFGTNAQAVTNHIKSAIYEYKETSSNTWVTGATTLTVTESGSNFSFSGAIQGDLGATGFDISKSFNIRITVKDELSTKTNTITLGAGNPAIAISSDNKVAIGQKYDTSVGGALQVNGDIKGNNFSGNSTTATTSSYLKTPNIAGYQTNQYGNLQHQRNTSSDAWQFLNNAGTVKAEYVWETGVFKSNGLELNTKPVVLYNNAPGTTGTVTLSQTAANFSYLDIFFREQSNPSEHSYARIYSPNGKCVNLVISSTDSSHSDVWVKVRTVSISGTSLTTTLYAEGAVKGNTATASNFIYIVRVEGYK